MTNNRIAPPPPRKKKKKTKKPPSFSSIPDDVIVNVFAGISRSHYPCLCLVSKSFYSLLSSPDIHFARSLIGNTDARLYVRLWLPDRSSVHYHNHHHSWFTLGNSQGQLSLVPVRTLSSSYSPDDRFKSTTVAVHSEIYQMGGSNKEESRSRAVGVFDCRSRTWRRAPDMKVARKHARSYFVDDKIYVTGGCRKTEETTTWGEVFDLKTQTWKPLPKPPSGGDGRHVISGAVYGGRRLYVFNTSNYKNYAYDPKEERWVQKAWFMGLGRITGPLCVIGSVIVAEQDSKYVWYEPRNGIVWSTIRGLDDVYTKRAMYSRTIQLVNHGGKLVIMWNETRTRTESYTVWCAVISLEERSTPPLRNMWGKVERCNVVLTSYNKSEDELSSCLSVLV